MNSTHHITQLLHDWNNGDAEALNRLIPLADSELKKIARKYMRKERPGHLLQRPTELINEAWVKLFKERQKVVWTNRRQFYSLLALRMRQVLLDYARKHINVQHTGITGKVISHIDCQSIVRVNELLDEFSLINRRAAELVELRYFGGCNPKEAAEILGVSESTVTREWKFAKSWLWREMTRNRNAN